MATRSPGSRRRTKKMKDVALILDKTEGGDGFHVLRRREEAGEATVELGTVQPLREGKAIDGEVVSFRPRKDVPFLLDVKTELPAPRRATSDGPPQVATDKYRAGWDAIWGPRRVNSPGSEPN